MPKTANDNHDHSHHEGLARDLLQHEALKQRRDFLAGLGALALMPAFMGLGCGTAAMTPAQDAGGTGEGGLDAGGSPDVANPATCTQIPNETGGPFPGDGTNGPNALTSTGIVRSDMRDSFDTFTGAAAGTTLRLTLKLVSVAGGCASLADHAIYAWHCDKDGKYSMYDVTTVNYLRGVQVTNANGTVTFTTIFPGCYAGRWPHIHFEIFRNLASATTGRAAIKTSQLALPEAECKAAYAATGYEASVTNLARNSLARDNVFSDGYTAQLAMVTGDLTRGFDALLIVAV
jgi:protocatechuate 3,4-dioxygenase beta subunit